jgi:hypothetical protein
VTDHWEAAGTLWLLALGSCHLPSTSEPVPVQGSQSERTLVAGEWTGRYQSEATGRQGKIHFSLGERADTGRGEVEITFSPALRMARDAASVNATKQNQQVPAPDPRTLIHISMVQVESFRAPGSSIMSIP